MNILLLFLDRLFGALIWSGIVLFFVFSIRWLVRQIKEIRSFRRAAFIRHMHEVNNKGDNNS